MGKVYYSYKFGNKTKDIKVTDEKLKKILERLADYVGNGKIWLTSGDRTHVPDGGSTTSRHLHNMAADMIIGGFNSAEGQKSAFLKIYEKRKSIFIDHHKYEIIYHGKFTKTTGLHIHIGRFPTGTGLYFYTEGVYVGEKLNRFGH